VVKKRHSQKCWQLQIGTGSLAIRLVFTNSARKCITYVWIYGLKKNFKTLIEYYTQTITDGTILININHCIPWIHISTAIHHHFITKQVNCGVYFSIMHHMKTPIHKSRSCFKICVTDFINHSCLAWCNAAICVDDVVMPSCSAGQTNDFLEMSPL
jgi:hypothetical protein